MLCSSKKDFLGIELHSITPCKELVDMTTTTIIHWTLILIPTRGKDLIYNAEKVHKRN